jgi:hypothetical protein
MDTLQKEVQHFRSSFDLGEIIRRAIKYLIEGLVVGICAYVIPSKKMDTTELLVISLTASTTFAILDIFSPSIGAASRSGAGFALGSGLTGGIKLM